MAPARRSVFSRITDARKPSNFVLFQNGFFHCSKFSSTILDRVERVALNGKSSRIRVRIIGEKKLTRN